MAYILMGVVYLVFLIFYILYLLVIKKDRKQFNAVIFPGIFFVAVWILLYVLVMK